MEEKSWFHVGKVIGRGSSKACKAKGSPWFWRVVDGFQLPTSMKTHFQLRSRFKDRSATEEAPNGSVFYPALVKGVIVI